VCQSEALLHPSDEFSLEHTVSGRDPVLTFGIPTYRRADCLDRQLDRLSNAVVSSRHEVEFLVSYNESGDATAEVCRRWADRLGPRFRAVRQEQITGMLPNVEYLYRHARGTHVWIVADDDVISLELIDRVIGEVVRAPETGVIHLNHHWVDARTGRKWGGPMYDATSDRSSAPGKEVIEWCLRQVGGEGLYLMTSLVFHRERVIQANDEWPEANRNLAYVLYLAARVAVEHRATLLAGPAFDCLTGNNGWLRFRRRLIHYDEPEVYFRLLRLGYDRSLVRKLILDRVCTTDIRQLARIALLYPLEFPRHALSSVGMYWRAMRLSVPHNS
jgi:abequosyltransferase